MITARRETGGDRTRLTGQLETHLLCKGHPMKGYLILSGGEAFSPRSKVIDHIWLQLVRQGQKRPRLMVIPVACIEKAILTAQETAGYFRNLGTYPDHAAIVDQISANSAQF